ncbi:hypothetical protein [Agromyces bracchium]|uniref:Lipoprotein n=1 Tax=Agromyces bracchium TaxID=88376 RepID=A0A6I3ME38_9MICO|nr:hypothetical protein [Agromyces bracchium]MTH68563.1 hypothetical protein [Agromyces bracchium]
MSLRRISVVVPVGLAIALGLAACAPTGPGTGGGDGYAGFPPGHRPEAFDESPRATLLDDGTVLAITTWGSSSCHREVDQVEWDGTLARVHVDRAGGFACTADMAAYTTELDVPEASAGRITEVELTYEDWDGVDRLTVE